VYPYSVQNINGCELAFEAADCALVLITQHADFMLVNFMYSRILYFNHSSEDNAMLRLACLTGIPLF
jgi:hypothetical protein